MILWGDSETRKVKKNPKKKVRREMAKESRRINRKSKGRTK